MTDPYTKAVLTVIAAALVALAAQRAVAALASSRARSRCITAMNLGKPSRATRLSFPAMQLELCLSNFPSALSDHQRAFNSLAERPSG